MKPQTIKLVKTLLGLATAAVTAITVWLATFEEPPPPAPAPAPNPAEFVLTTLGPKQVYAGHDLYFVVSGKRTEGTPENTYISAGEATFSDIARTCCKDAKGAFFIWGVDKSFATSVRATAKTPGPQTVEVQIKNSQLSQTVKHTFEVLPLPKATTPTFTTLGPVPSLARYKEQMLAKGKAQLGDREKIITAGTWEGNAWYYDGTRVAYQIADYTGDQLFAEFAEHPLAVYRPYVLDNKGAVSGWRVFPRGLRMHYERTGDVQSKEAALSLLKAAYGANGLNTHGLIPEATSREVAYAIETMLEAEKLGQPRHARLTEYVDIALGHCDQWFVQEKYARMAPFMFALTAEALIQYHEATGDPRILPVLKRGADWIWQRAWVAADRAFVYELKDGADTKGAPDLNLLIAPVYGWVYSQTGDKSYIDKGDQIFAGGVDGAWLDQGKQFCQSYRWSLDYLKWREAQ